MAVNSGSPNLVDLLADVQALLHRLDYYAKYPPPGGGERETEYLRGFNAACNLATEQLRKAINLKPTQKDGKNSVLGG